MGIVAMLFMIFGLWHLISPKAALLMIVFLALGVFTFHTNPDPRRCEGTARHWTCL